MFKDTNYMGGDCGYVSHCCRRACRWAIFLVFVFLVGWGIDTFIQDAPRHTVIAAAATIVLLLGLKKFIITKRVMRRMLELKIAKFVPDIYGAV